MSKPIERVEIISGIHRRRRYTAEEKVRLVEQTMQPGMTVSAVARLHRVSPSLLFQWRRRMSEGGHEAVRADEEVVPLSRVRELESKVRELERLLGRKTMETEILRDALEAARQKKALARAIAAQGKYPAKAVADTLGVARSNLVEHLRRADRPRRGPYVRAGDDEIIAEIRTITDARPIYGYRRVTALLNRARRGSGKPTLNHKRVFRLMRMASLLLQPCTGRRVIRAHEGVIIAPASNQRWASDGFEISCWNGEIVRIAKDGHGSPSMVRELRELETRCETLEREVTAAGEVEPAPLLHPNLPQLYRRRVERLEQDLLEPELNALATEALRLLVESILVFPGEGRGEVEVSLCGDLAFFLHADAQESCNEKPHQRC